jgi:hypothetical protein
MCVVLPSVMSLKFRANCWLRYMWFYKVCRAVLSATAKMFDLLNKDRRGKILPITKVSICFIIDSVWELLHMPS